MFKNLVGFKILIREDLQLVLEKMRDYFIGRYLLISLNIFKRFYINECIKVFLKEF